MQVNTEKKRNTEKKSNRYAEEGVLNRTPGHRNKIHKVIQLVQQPPTISKKDPSPVSYQRLPIPLLPMQSSFCPEIQGLWET